ncbi:MAG: cell division protein ZapA [Chlorobi bacterium]|nr:cell division protein ZapA [Chlorobiota bacterium]
MDNKLTIKVNIVDRIYPLKIDREEEEKIRKAAKKINDTVLQYKKIYSDKDDQDFLAMAALQFVTKVVEQQDSKELDSLIESLKDLNLDLEEVLEKE